jgi:hypothetical protein
MKTIIAGSRTITNYEMLEDFIKAIQQYMPGGMSITEVVSGKARGVDMLGEQWAAAYGVPIVGFPADWNTYGRSAGHIRNAEMANYAEAAIILWDHYSSGTADMIQLATKTHLRLFVFTTT